ncbi:ABC transporter substrate-binding protein [Planctomonas psychrotolerans]|uniref:ABC transporter substrate-binding protein n=1 Tax=Planctomonas psychrotolerans TaxID=2528712 RepID=UPI001239CC71|nr:ABC transporter substrate-binding protein [Planctomonas psychrotolerans]
MLRTGLRAFAPVVALSTLVVLGGCSSPAGEEATTDERAPLATVDTMFGEIEVPAPEGGLRVVALGWSDAEMALALGVTPIAVFDWQSFGAENKGVGPWATDLFGDETPEILERADESLNYEQLEVLDPDLILNTRSGNDEQEFERLNEIAPTVYAPEGTAPFATSWDVQMATVAEALGQGDEGAELIEATEAAIATAAEEHPEFEGLTTAAGTKFADAYGAYLPGDGRFDILADLGFVNNPAITELEPSGFYAAVSAEQVSVLDADVPVIYPIGFTLDETQSDPLLASLSAVQDGRAVFLDPDADLSGAYAAASTLSIEVVLEELVPMLADAAAKVAP